MNFLAPNLNRDGTEDRSGFFVYHVDLAVGIGWTQSLSFTKSGPESLRYLTSILIEDLIRKSTDRLKDPGCRNLISLTTEQQAKALEIQKYVEDLCPSVVKEMLDRVLSYTGEGRRKASPMDVWVLIHPGFKQLSIPRREDRIFPLPNTHKAVLDCLYRCQYLRDLNLAGLDEHSTPPDYNDFNHSSEIREHYLNIIDDGLRRMTMLVTLNLGTLVNNNIMRTLSLHCSLLKEFRIRGSAQVTDLGIRYLLGLNESAQDTAEKRSPGCLQLEVLDLTDVEKISLHSLTLALIHLKKLRIFEHNHLHEALWLMHKTGMDSKMLDLKLTGYNGRGPAQCSPDYLEVLQILCPHLQTVHLCMTFPETFFPLSRFREINHLSIYRVSALDNFDLPLMAFGAKLVKLELRNCTNFQSGSALYIRKHCSSLRSLILEIDSTDSNSNNSLAEAVAGQDLNTLQNQVTSLQDRLNTLQQTMISVMDKYDGLAKLEHLHLKNLSMGSLLIILPFAPNLVKLTLKYSLRNDTDGAPNLSDSLFLKIVEKNNFSKIQCIEIWCKTLSIRTAEWFVHNCPQLASLKSLSFWNINEEEQVALWREGRRREPIPVEIDF